MAGHWKEVVRLRFKGERFRDHALDLSALAELSQFQKLVSETAKAIWHAAYPDLKRLPARFDERTRLCLRQIEEGTAVTPLEVWLEDPELVEHEDEVDQAIALAHEVFDAVDRDVPLPERFPRQLVPDYAKWGQSLGEDEEVELIAPRKPAARISKRHGERLARFAEGPYEAAAEATGEVLEADVRQRRFQLWRDARTAISVSFDGAQEELVTTALKDHRMLRVRVEGRGEYSPTGQLQRFLQVDLLEAVSLAPTLFDTSAPAIEEVLASIAAEVPKEDWDRLPPDLTEDMDHYVYGTPKR